MGKEEQPDDRLGLLEESIGYRFRSRPLLLEALTHRSFCNEQTSGAERDNQRLEFFGDAVLDFFVSRLLLDRFPAGDEGDLTRLRSSLVDEGGLARLAAGLEMGEYLRLGRGEARSGGRSKPSLLADAFEAVVAAIYLDGGARPVQRLVRRLFGPLLQDIASRAERQDPKSAFQELAQARRLATPRYLLVAATGPDHDRTFRVAAYIGNRQVGEGTGRSKKEAEQAAARQGLDVLGVLT